MTPPKSTFKIVGFDQGGRRDSVGESNNVRLVCLTPTGQKVVAWGTEGKNTQNIEKIESAGLPCEIECEYRPPDPAFRSKYGHTHWVREDMALKVL